MGAFGFILLATATVGGGILLGWAARALSVRA